MQRRNTIEVIQAGATGPVADAFRWTIAQADVPFRLEAVAASREEHIGKKLGQITAGVMVAHANIPVISLEDAVHNTDASLIFSGLRNEEAAEYEDQLAEHRVVATNAGVNRMREDVALANAYISAGQIKDYLDKHQDGHIVANGNCTSIILSVAIARLHRSIGISALDVKTLQGWSGAGERAVPGHAVGQILPIEGDEKVKIETEPKKLMGTLDAMVDIDITANPQRGPWVAGHYIAARLKLERPTSRREIVGILRKTSAPHRLRRYTHNPLIASAEPIQIIGDRELLMTNKDGVPAIKKPPPMRVDVRISNFDEKCPDELDLEIVGNNICLGAAGSSVMNMLYAYEINRL